MTRFEGSTMRRFRCLRIPLRFMPEIGCGFPESDPDSGNGEFGCDNERFSPA